MFEDNAFSIPVAPIDSIVYANYHDLSPRYNELVRALDSITTRFGPFRLRKRYPTADTGRFSQVFYLEFQISGSLHALTLDTVLEKLPNVGYVIRYFGSLWLVSVDHIDQPNTTLQISLTPDQRTIIVQPLLQFHSQQATIANIRGEVVMRVDIDNAAPTYIDISSLQSGANLIVSSSGSAKFSIAR